MAGPHLPAPVAGAGAAVVPVVQLDEALEQEGERGEGGREVRGLVEQVEAGARTGARLFWEHGLCGHSTRLPGPSTSSAARSRWGMPPRTPSLPSLAAVLLFPSAPVRRRRRAPIRPIPPYVSWEVVFLEVTPGVNYPDTGGSGPLLSFCILARRPLRHFFEPSFTPCFR